VAMVEDRTGNACRLVRFQAFGTCGAAQERQTPGGALRRLLGAGSQSGVSREKGEIQKKEEKPKTKRTPRTTGGFRHEESKLDRWKDSGQGTRQALTYHTL
jgi:hypothetical protein